jgi:hypothetical protein
MWSKDGRFMDGLHAVGDIITKISVNCVIYLHVALLFTCVFCGFLLCMFITISMFMGISRICCMSVFIFILV